MRGLARLRSPLLRAPYRKERADASGKWCPVEMCWCPCFAGGLGLDAFGEKVALRGEVGDAALGRGAVLFAPAGEAGHRRDLDFDALVPALVVAADAGSSFHWFFPAPAAALSARPAPWPAAERYPCRSSAAFPVLGCACAAFASLFDSNPSAGGRSFVGSAGAVHADVAEG